MKIAFHFKCGHFTIRYDEYFYSHLFSKYLNTGACNLDTDIRTGDLLVHSLRKNYTASELLRELVIPNPNSWRAIEPENVPLLYNEAVFVICFETISKEQALILDKIFDSDENYLGGFEIIENSELHNYLYQEVLGKRMRVTNRNLIWYVGFDHQEYEDDTDDMIRFLREMPFQAVSVEELYE